MKKFFELIAAIVVCQLAGILGSIFTSQTVSSWYVELTKPSFTPPDAVFGPVWITLYTLMGIALWLVWQKRDVKKWFLFTGKNKVANTGLVLFLIQLLMNILWSIMFFGLENPWAGFIVIVELLIFIVLTIIWFWRVNKLASILLWPYLAWVSFATALNLMIALLN